VNVEGDLVWYTRRIFRWWSSRGNKVY